MNKAQSEKSKFRKSSRWVTKRIRLKKLRKVDAITLQPLRKGWNLHHLDLREEHYQRISDEERFECLNKMTHEMIHNLYRYWSKDKTIINRIEIILNKMEMYSND